jgi:hypothetical protein
MLEIKELDRKQWKNYELYFSYKKSPEQIVLGFFSFFLISYDLCNI